MKIVKWLLRRDIIWIIIASIVCYVIVTLPIIDNIRNAPPDRYYYGGEEYPLDMLGNLATVQLGYHGYLTRIPKITTVFQGSGYLLKFEYILTGWIARIFVMDPLVSYYLVRGLVSLLYLGTIAWIIRRIFPKGNEGVLAFVLVVFGAAITIPGRAWVPMDRVVFDALPLIRTTFAMTHYMLGGLYTMLSLYFLARSIDLPARSKHYLTAIILAFLSSFAYAPTMVVVILTLPIFFFLYMCTHQITLKRVKMLAMPLWMVGIYAGVALLPMLYVRYLSINTWDFTTHGILEKLNPFTLTVQEYFLTVGIPYVLSWFALPNIIKKKKTYLLLLAGWLIIHPLVEFFLSDLIGLNRIRMLLTPYFVVFGLLATEGIRMIASKNFPRLFTKQVISLGLVIVIIASGYLSYAIVYRRTHVCFCSPPMFDYSYPNRDLMQAIWWLKGHTKETDNVLSGYYAGTLIPAFAGNSVYTSWWFRLTNLPEVGYTRNLVDAFYREIMTPSEAQEFIDANHISYVLVSQEERSLMTANRLSYPFLKEAGSWGDTSIYARNE